jgi:aldehyde dehydrogenase (NAD+)
MSKLQPFSKLWVNNQETASISGKQITLIDPSTGQEWFKVDEADAEDVEVAVQHAEAAWPAWAELPGAARGKALRKFAELMVQHHEDLAEVESKTMGKPWQFLKFDVLISAAIIDYFASLADTAQSSVSTNTPGMFNYTLHQPYGVTAAIIPWNITFASFAFKVGASLAAGNALILKSSEKAPLSPLLLAKLSADAGFPPGILQVVSGYGPTAGAALAKHLKVRKISFTGSLAVGKLVQEMGAKSNLKAVTLELGGKSPGIVFADADLQEAAEALAFSITAWSGQTVSCPLPIRTVIFITFPVHCNVPSIRTLFRSRQVCRPLHQGDSSCDFQPRPCL